MRRQVAISKRILTASLVGTITLTSAKLVADVRQQLGSSNSQPTVSQIAPVSPTKDTNSPETKLQKKQASDEQLAEQQLSRMTPAKHAAEQTQDAGPLRQIVISIPDRQLALLEDGIVIRTYPIAVGKRSTPSPSGEFTVINRAKNPVYRHDGQVVMPGKNNPVGTRWMGLSLRGYGIHGTNVQSSIGKAASHGCFRMKKNDVEELFTLVRVGDAVSVRGERDELVARTFRTAPVTGEVTIASAAPIPTGDQE
jgi:lipoprotein-anchoring transpeptidase ErfK/SrfK